MELSTVLAYAAGLMLNFLCLWLALMAYGIFVQRVNETMAWHTSIPLFKLFRRTPQYEPIPPMPMHQSDFARIPVVMYWAHELAVEKQISTERNEWNAFWTLNTKIEFLLGLAYCALSIYGAFEATDFLLNMLTIYTPLSAQDLPSLLAQMVTLGVLAVALMGV